MKAWNLCLAVGLSLFLLSSIAFADIDQILGNWKNTEPLTRGLPLVEIAAKGHILTVHAWGKGHPVDLDWGTVEAVAYAEKVESPLPKEAIAISAVFKTSYSETILIIRPIEGNQLKVENLTRFTDDSGRSAFRKEYTFTRTDAEKSKANGGVESR
ncbi:MAG: hypothetical protein GX442_05500 [Candidatus Riflebacteria bacterium]|nr:hypothetical protein [Candidatus Riflebacteria bacterium]